MVSKVANMGVYGTSSKMQQSGEGIKAILSFEFLENSFGNAKNGGHTTQNRSSKNPQFYFGGSSYIYNQAMSHIIIYHLSGFSYQQIWFLFSENHKHWWVQSNNNSKKWYQRHQKHI